MAARRPIPYGRQDISNEDVDAVVACLRGDFLTQGPRVGEFEEALRDATGARFAVAVSSGTAALHLAYLALGLGKGDLGITSSVSFVASSNGMLYTGAGVAFADVDPDTGIVRPQDVDEALERVRGEGRTAKVITPVDLAGQPFDRAEIEAIARRHGAAVLEDAAHSLGADYEVDGTSYKVGSCSHADAAILSFHPVKHVTTAEGGAIVTNDPKLHARLVELRTHGIHKDPARFERAADDPFIGPWYYEQTALGFNYRITDLQCALGTSQMKRLRAFVRRRQEIAARYDRAFAEGVLAKHLVPARRLPGRSHAHHLYVAKVRRDAHEDVARLARRKKEIFLRLAEERIHCQVHYIPIPWQPFYAKHPDVVRGTYPGAELYYASAFSIPMFPAMTDDDVSAVIAALERACEA